MWPAIWADTETLGLSANISDFSFCPEQGRTASVELDLKATV
jgi:hypothetical protein